MRRSRLAVFVTAAVISIVAAGCGASSDSCGSCSDIVAQIPWSAPESHTYTLKIDGKERGRTTLTIAKDSHAYALTQRSEDDAGNSDESTVRADSATLKPIANTHVVIDKSQKRVANAVYEDVDKDCDSKRVVKITQDVFEPPDETTPDNTRRSPLCVPEHAYDNDSSLFLWRTVKFEKGYKATYYAVLPGRRDTQIISLEVHDIVDKTPLGDGKAWEVRLFADQINQRAWFSTEPDHKLLAYQNDNYLFLLNE